MNITIGNIYQDNFGDKIRVLDICENPKDKSRVVLYKKNKQKKVFQSFHDVLISTLTERK